MGTVAETVIYGPREAAEKASDAVRDVFFVIEKTCNIFDPESELSKLNASAFEKPFKCGPLLWEVLCESRDAWRLSGGDFDITAKPLMDLWGFYRKRERLPSKEETAETLARVGLDKVLFDDNERTVRFTVKGMSFDLGGIAKGFAVDKAYESAVRAGVSRGVINLGGNMRFFPLPPPGKESYTLGIRNPLGKDSVCGKINALAVSVATSGNYERYVTIDGVQLTHIMNVKTGEPVKNMLSATVVTPSALTADILSTTVFIKGDAFAADVCAKIPRTSALIIKNNPGNPLSPVITKFGPAWAGAEFSVSPAPVSDAP
jgi:thiamine biosynthesis lipoprotein